jgi:hypothetical protein
MRKYLAAFLVALFPVFAFAGGPTAIDVTAAVGQLETIDTTLLAVGGALLVAAAVAVAVKWAKAAIFG